MPPRNARRFRLPWGFSLLLLAGGCGGPNLYPVEGTIAFSDGTPAKELAGGTVEFDPVEGKRSASGEIVEGGKFHLRTERPEDGVEPGVYRVRIVPLRDLDRPAPNVMDSRFERLETSDLKVTVEPKNNQVTLTVERARKKR